MVRPMIRSRRRCSIINISSVLGARGVKGTAVYAATKAGVVGFTKALAVELGARNIRVNAICPGLVDNTAMASSVNQDMQDMYKANSPSGRLVPVEEIANVAVMLVTSEHINGSVLTIDGGFTA